CYVRTSCVVEIIENIEVTFNDLPTSDVCAIADLPEVSILAITSEERIPGVWSYTEHVEATYTYTFTVDDGQGCYVGTSFVVEIIESIEVTFNQLPTSDVCAIADLPEVSNLPITSEEGITGVWPQTDKGDETYTYTLTVDES